MFHSLGKLYFLDVLLASETVFGISKEILIELDKKDLNALNLLDELNLIYYGVLDFTFQFFADMFVEGKLIEEECIKKLEEHYKKYVNILF